MSGHVRINAAYAPLYEVRTRYVLVFGGRRSGKSVAVSQILVRRACEYPRRRVLVIRKFATSLRMSVWARVQEAISESIGLQACEVNKGERRITLANGSEFLFTGTDDPERLKSLEGISDVWEEEATELAEIDHDTVDAGLSAVCEPPTQMFLSFNPVPAIPGAPHWLQRRFLNRVPHELGQIAVQGEVAILKTWYRDNRFCPETTVRLLNSYEADNPDLFEMWAKGNWVSLRGAILDPRKIRTVAAIPDSARRIGFGIDFGFSADPAACVGVWMQDGQLYLREYLYATGLTNRELSDALVEAGLRKGIDSLVADSAEPKSIRELAQLGWLINPAEKGADYKRAAANYLRGFVINVTADSTNLIRELHSWSWKMDRDNRPLPVAQDGEDHLVDALIYRTFRNRGSIDLDTISAARADVRGLRQSIIDKNVRALVPEEEIK